MQPSTLPPGFKDMLSFGLIGSLSALLMAL
jgi:hypothetical protein